MPKKKSNWGGRRVAGPGKKIGKPLQDGARRHSKSFRCSDEVSDYLAETGTPQIEDMIRRSAVFKKWLAIRRNASV